MDHVKSQDDRSRQIPHRGDDMTRDNKTEHMASTSS